MASIVDVAKEAKVSLGTVSMVLNQKHRVRPETRQRVEAVIQRLRYRPRSPRCTLSRRAVKRLAFVYTAETLEVYCRKLITGVQDELNDSCSLNILRGEDCVDHDPMFCQSLADQEFDGLIIAGAEQGNSYLVKANRAGLPVVLFNCIPEHGEGGAVTADYYGGARQAVDYVVKLGHQRLAHLFLHPSNSWSSRQLHQGLVDATQSLPHGLVQVAMPREEASIDLRPFCEQALAQQATVLLVNGRLAPTCADTLEAMGVRVPEDVSVLGFDELGLKTKRGQELTAMDCDKRRMGRLAAHMLQMMLEADGQLCWMSNGVVTYVHKGQTCDRPGSPGR